MPAILWEPHWSNQAGSPELCVCVSSPSDSPQQPSDDTLAYVANSVQLPISPGSILYLSKPAGIL